MAGAGREGPGLWGGREDEKAPGGVRFVVFSSFYIVTSVSLAVPAVGWWLAEPANPPTRVPVRCLCWQTENGVLLPSLQSALPFLDLHGTPRLEFHQSVFDELREKLLERVSAIALEGKVEERFVGGLVGYLE